MPFSVDFTLWLDSVFKKSDPFSASATILIHSHGQSVHPCPSVTRHNAILCHRMWWLLLETNGIHNVLDKIKMCGRPFKLSTLVISIQFRKLYNKYTNIVHRPIGPDSWLRSVWRCPCCSARHIASLMCTCTSPLHALSSISTCPLFQRHSHSHDLPVSTAWPPLLSQDQSQARTVVHV